MRPVLNKLSSVALREVKYGIEIGSDWLPYGTNLGVPKCIETDLKKSQICPILGQSGPIWMPNLKFDIPALLKPRLYLQMMELLSKHSLDMNTLRIS